MLPPHANILRTHAFSHKGNSYDVSAYTTPNDPDRSFVDVTHAGNPVIYTYPDGFQATHEYSVKLTTAIDFSKAHGISAVTHLMEDAEQRV